MQPDDNKVKILSPKAGDSEGQCGAAGYARPSTRGELWDLLLDGVSCEVVTSNVEITKILLDGWMGSLDYKVLPSENEGWSVFKV